MPLRTANGPGNDWQLKRNGRRPLGVWMDDCILGGMKRRRRLMRCSVRKKEARVFHPSAIATKGRVLTGLKIWRAVCTSGSLIGTTMSTMRNHHLRILAGRPREGRKFSEAGHTRIIHTGSEARFRSEWVADWYDDEYYEKSPSQNPRGPSEGGQKVQRSGSYSNNPYRLRSSFRTKDNPTEARPNVGFRCVQNIPKTP